MKLADFGPNVDFLTGESTTRGILLGDCVLEQVS